MLTFYQHFTDRKVEKIEDFRWNFLSEIDDRKEQEKGKSKQIVEFKRYLRLYIFA
jgi:hypothetical protein